MASTPDTSFSSEDLHSRGRSSKRRQRLTPSKLPSPESELDDADDAVEQAYKTIWAHFCGLWSSQDCDTNPTFYLRDQQSYERLYQRLAENKGLFQHFEQEIRRDWDSTTGRLTLRLMASPLHDFFIHYIAHAIDKELDRIAFTTPSLRPFRSKIVFGGSATVQKRGHEHTRAPEFEKSPDGQWHHSSSRYPPLVLEVAYSQDEKNLDDKVTQYFENLPGGICGVLGFAIEYAERPQRKAETFSHTASVSLWSSEQEDEVLCVHRAMNNICFRDQNGQPRSGELVLPFTSFLPFKERKKAPPAATQASSNIHITFAALSEFVDNAERRQRIIEGTVSPSSEPEVSLPRQKRVMWKDEAGEVYRDVIVKRRRKTVLGQRGDNNGGLVLGRTRSQTRSASRPRRSSRVRSVKGSQA